MHTAVLVEGESDREAVLAAAEGTRTSLAGVEVVAMGGITNIRRHVEQLRAVRLVGLYDAGEERFVRRALGEDGSLSTAGFHRCDRDLEEELIRTLGAARVLEVVEAEGGGASFRRLQQMPAQRGWTVERQLHRFFGAGSGRKVRYARLLTGAACPDLPAPLAAVLRDASH